MPVNFITDEQQAHYGVYPPDLTEAELNKYFHLDDKDRGLIAACRRDYNKLGYALQLVTVRFLGMFLANPLNVPEKAKRYLVKVKILMKKMKQVSHLFYKDTLIFWVIFRFSWLR